VCAREAEAEDEETRDPARHGRRIAPAAESVPDRPSSDRTMVRPRPSGHPPDDALAFSLAPHAEPDPDLRVHHLERRSDDVPQRRVPAADVLRRGVQLERGLL
jgi:hypothetical protein